MVTEGTYLRFDDLRVEFVTKSKQLALQSKLRDIKVQGKQIQLPLVKPIELNAGQSLSLSVLLRAKSNTADTVIMDLHGKAESVKDVNMML